jgi:hypothetical protein
MRRQQAVSFLLSLVLLTATARAAVSHSGALVIGRLPCADTAFPRAHGLRTLLWEVVKRTSIEAELESIAIDPSTASMFRTPLLICSCTGPIAPLSEGAIAQLRQFLMVGGFLFVDDPAAQPGGPFDLSIRDLLKKLFPDRPLTALSFDHVLFKTFFLLDQVAGRKLVKNRYEGISLEDRLVVLYSGNDLLGATSRDLFGNWEFLCELGGEPQRELSFRFGINMVMYALCLDYKNDRVHLPFILKRRRL